ncbi:sugar transferase [Patescibacteria group bacterium]|nr:sugar transferase [Patescibacteria group bacterium]MBU4389848.1 sugar transferase [Patescibacteria group bacterium]MBU4430887.1 sugar transferase [Patescibacteria group bacterium]
MCIRWLILLLIVLLLPFFLFLSLLIIVFSGWPIFFVQKRMGKDGKVFKIYKFRTMRKGSEKEKKKYLKLNEVDWPVFKIRNDPRFTRIGKFLSHTGLDELPQLLNVLKGEMAIVGPRPLPVDEEKEIAGVYREARRSVLPGIISSWILSGYHLMSFDNWMKQDLEHIRKKSFMNDMLLLFKALPLVLKLILKEIIG